MQRKSLFILGFIFILLTAGFVTLRAGSDVKQEESTCCKKTTTECTEKKKSTDDMLPENLSHQFIMIGASTY